VQEENRRARAAELERTGYSEIIERTRSLAEKGNIAQLAFDIESDSIGYNKDSIPKIRELLTEAVKNWSKGRNAPGLWIPQADVYNVKTVARHMDDEGIKMMIESLDIYYLVRIVSDGLFDRTDLSDTTKNLAASKLVENGCFGEVGRILCSSASDEVKLHTLKVLEQNPTSYPIEKALQIQGPAMSEQVRRACEAFLEKMRNPLANKSHQTLPFCPSNPCPTMPGSKRTTVRKTRC
jgi:hypothetical protein